MPFGLCELRQRQLLKRRRSVINKRLKHLSMNMIMRSPRLKASMLHRWVVVSVFTRVDMHACTLHIDDTMDTIDFSSSSCFLCS